MDGGNRDDHAGIARLAGFTTTRDRAMRRLFAPALLALLACGPTGELLEAQDVTIPDGYEQLLKDNNGRYHKGGWNHYGPGYFELDPATGVLTSHGGMGLFWYSVKEFGDFVLELDFLCADENTNSGVFLRVPGVPASDDYIYHSFEIQIDDASEGIHHTGAAYDAEAPTHLASNPPGEWNHFKITFVGSRLQVELNGQEVLDWEAEPRGKVEDFALRGYIGLQNHDDQSPVSFRNIVLMELE
jgi:hypothetical protein